MKRKSISKPQKPYWEMTADELHEATKEFDGPISPSRLRPLTGAERKEWDRIINSGPIISIHERSKSRRQNGPANGRELVVRLDDELFTKAAAYAKQHKTSLPKMIDRGLRGLLAFSS